MTKSSIRNNPHAETVVLQIENAFVAPWTDPTTPPDSSSRATVRVAIKGGDPKKEYDLFFRFPVSRTAWFMLTETSSDRPTSLSSFKLKGGEIREIYVANSNSEETLLESWIEFGPTDNSDIEPGYCYFSL